MLTIWMVRYGDFSTPGECTNGLPFGSSEDDACRDESALFATKHDAMAHAEQNRPCAVWEVFVTKASVLAFARDHAVHGPSAPAVCRCRVNGEIEQESNPVSYHRGRFTVAQFPGH